MRCLHVFLFVLALASSTFGQRNRGSSATNLPIWQDSGWFVGGSSDGNPPGGSADAARDRDTVSVVELKIPSRAIREIERSQKSYEAGKLQDSIDHLRKALQIYPKYAEAHNVLGLRYVQTHQMENALEEFDSALALKPNFYEAINNQSVALYSLGRYAEAEVSARYAISTGPVQESTRCLLGLILTAQNRFTQEALHLLQDVRARYPAARLALAALFLRHGHPEAAIPELQAYVDLPDVPDRDKVACSLANLTHSSPTDCGPN